MPTEVAKIEARPPISRGPLLQVAIGLPFALGYCRMMVPGITKHAFGAGNWVMNSLPNHDLNSLPLVTLPRYDGLIGHISQLHDLARLQRLARCFINISNQKPPAWCPRVVNDDYAIGKLGAKHLLARGHRHLVFYGYEGHLYTKLRAQGFVDTCRMAEVSATDKSWMSRNEFVEWLKTAPKPMAVMAANDGIARQVMESAWEVGLRVPQDIAFLGVDNDETICAFCRVPLSSVRPAAERLGFLAAQTLDRMMRGEVVSNEPTLVPPIGIEARESTAGTVFEDTAMAEAVDVIRHRAHLGLGVGELAEAVGLGRRSLERRFRDALGVSPYYEILRLRVERAKRLLVETDLTIESLAQQTGFSEARFLNAAFRKHVGMVPSAYRARHRLR